MITTSAAYLLAIAATSMAQSASGGDSVDRSMRFVERSMEATDLLNAGKPAEALPVLQELVDRDGDLDADGFAQLSLGDCLAQLNRPDEARRTFLRTAAAHPDRKSEVDQRLLDLELAGPITDDLILRLRAAAGVAEDSRYVGTWNLGRALQRKAMALLDEATACFATACAGTSPLARDLCRSTHQGLLTLVRQELASAIAKAESRWQRGATTASLSEYDDAQTESSALSACRADWTIQTAEGKAHHVALRQDKKDGDKFDLTLEGKAVSLTPEQAALIRLHQEQIARILCETIGAKDTAERR
jgi:tetratricopeptide (TPR) repeat protein